MCSVPYSWLSLPFHNLPAASFVYVSYFYFTVIIIVCSFLFLTIATRGHTMIPPIFGFISFLKEVKKKNSLVVCVRTPFLYNY